MVEGKKYLVTAQKNPAELPWKKLDVDIVLECTGVFRTKEKAELHLKAGAKRVVISAPAKGEEKIKTIVLGVNENKITKNDKILSMASCTTNCLAPVTNIINKELGIKKALMTTVHSFTAGQNLVDGPNSDLRRARAASINIVPTTTGAATATTETIPGLKNKFDGMAIRVPTVVGSISDMVFLTSKKTTIEKVNNIFKKVSKNSRYKKIISTTSEPLVSTDIIGNPMSAIIDLSLTKVIGGDLLKVIAWYDNEWGYSCRMADLIEYLN